MAIHLNNDILRRAIARLHYPVPAGGQLHLFGLRGAVPASDTEVSLRGNEPDHFDDTIGIFGTVFMLCLGSVDPGAHYTKEPMNPQGCAHLDDGCWLFKRGTHKGSSGVGHSALVQAEAFKIHRDKNRNGRIDPGEPSDTGEFGIHIHASTNNPTIGAWSAGCQIIHSTWVGAVWTKFHDTVFAASQDRFRYYLFDAATLEAR